MDNTKILSYSMVSAALTDGKFYEVLPEFRTLSIKLKTLNVDITKPTGCTGCQKRRIEANMFKDFLYVVQALDANGLQRLKTYFKLDKLMINVQDHVTKAVTFKVV
jgi:hypothetical protein